MTVASSQSNRGFQRVSNFLSPETKHTALTTLRSNFDNVQEASKKRSVLKTLAKLAEDPRAIKTLLLDKGKENSNAFDLMEEMIKSEDQEVSNSALKVFTNYLALSPTRQNLVGTEIDPKTKKSNAETAFTEVIKFINEDDKFKKQEAALNIANTSGYLYQADGDDTKSTTWTRGQIDPQGKAGRDKRLFNFFQSMKTTESGKLLHTLLVDSGLQEIHETFAEEHTRDLEIKIGGKKNVLNNIVRQSLVEQKGINNISTNPFANWGDKSLTAVIEPDPTSTDEISFLEGFKKSADFSFSIAKLDKNFMEAGSTEARKELVLDFVTAFELLSFKKASLMEAGKGCSDPLLTKAAKKIEDQQEQMLSALQAHAGRDSDTAETIEELFKSNGAAIFMHHMKGAISTTDKAVSALVAGEVGELTKDYGTDSVKLNNGSKVTDSFHDLGILKKENEEEIIEQTLTLAKSALTITGQPETLDQEAISDFERLAGLSFSADVTDESKATAHDQQRLDKIKKTSSGKYFGITTAFQETMDSMKTSTDLSIIYVRDNFERIYGMKPDAMLDKLKDLEVITKKSGGADSFVITNQEKFKEALSQIAKDARTTQAASPKEFEFSHAVTTAKFRQDLNNAVIGNSTLKVERFIASIVNADTEAHQKVGFGEGEAGHLERLLLSEDIGDPENPKDLEFQKAERMLGVMELERRILDAPKKTDAEKEEAINYIHRDLLGDTSFSVSSLANHKANLEAALGADARDYKSVIAGSSTNTMASLLKARYKLDDLSITHGKVSESVLKFMRRETDLLVKGFNGAVPDGLFFNDPEATLEIMTELRTAIQVAKEAGNTEEANEKLESMMQQFRDIGYPVDLMINADTLNNGTWEDNFMFSDPLFYSPGSESSDIMKVFIEIWNSIIRKFNTETN